MSKSYLCLRFCHPHMDLDFLTKLLGLSCYRSWVAGTPRMTPTGNPLSGLNKESYWVSGDDVADDLRFSKDVTRLVSIVSSNIDSLEEFKETGGKIEIYLFLPGKTNVGDSIDASVLLLMGNLGIDLLIEVMPGA